MDGLLTVTNFTYQNGYILFDSLLQNLIQYIYLNVSNRPFWSITVDDGAFACPYAQKELRYSQQPTYSSTTQFAVELYKI